MLFFSKFHRSTNLFFFFFLGLSYLQITNTFTEPQVAFTGDTMSDFITDSSNIDVLKANILVVEVHYLFRVSGMCEANRLL